MKHLKFTVKESETHEFKIIDQAGKEWATTDHPVFAELMLNLLNPEFERVSLQDPEAKQSSKDIANETDE
jgi:hypothetical protein